METLFYQVLLHMRSLHLTRSKAHYRCKPYCTKSFEISNDVAWPPSFINELKLRQNMSRQERLEHECHTKQTREARTRVSHKANDICSFLRQNHLMMTIECEVLREFGRSAMAQERPASCCSALWQQREPQVKIATGSNSTHREDKVGASALDRLRDKFSKIKVEIQCLFAIDALKKVVALISYYSVSHGINHQ